MGYPDDNILFEDSQTAVLIQGKEEKLRTATNLAEKCQKWYEEAISKKEN